MENTEVKGVIGEIIMERIRQDAIWGEQNHAPPIWMLILGEEFGEAMQAAQESHFENLLSRGGGNLDHYRDELVQVAAVAVAAIESLDRQRSK